MSEITRTHFVMTPGIEKLSQYPYVLNLITDRVRGLLMGLSGQNFEDLAYEYVKKYMSAPEFPDDANGEKVDKVFRKEAKSIYKSFTEYEKNPSYQDSLQILKQYEGMNFSISSVTMGGVMVILTDNTAH